MSETPKNKFGQERRSHRHNSFFGPIILIAIGLYFLLNNFGYVSYSLNWRAALQLWPLALILIGLNIIVRQAPGFLGGFFSALIGVSAVALFGYVLFFSDGSQLLERFGISSPNYTEVMTEQIAFADDDVETAVVNIDFDSPPSELYALEDSRDLIQGQVAYAGNLIFETSVSGDEATIILDDQVDGNLFLNPKNWASFSEMDRWTIGLNPDVETDLTLDIGSGSAKLDLDELTLSQLEIDGGSGSAEIWLPGGEYDATIDIGSGSTKITLPGYGRQSITIDGGSGSLALYLPPGVEARVQLDDGSGGVYLNESRFQQVSGDEEDEGVWATAGYDEQGDGLDLFVDVSSGSLRIEDLQGR